MSSRRRFLAGAAGAGAAALPAPQERAAPAKGKLGVGLIGCGTRGTHLATVARSLAQEGAPADIIAVCDIYKPRRQRAEQRFGVPGYASAGELLRDPKVQGVIVATPDRVHVFNALEATRSGKDVYCEKPLTHWKQFDNLKELVKEVRARKNVFQVGAQWVTDPVWLRAAEAVRKGAIGRPTHAQCGYFRRGDGGERGMPIDDPNAKPGPDLNWDAFQADAPQHEFTIPRYFQWRMFMDYSGGPSTDLYPHAMTRLFKVLGVNMPSKVVAVGGKYVYNGERDVPDTFDLLIEYPEKLTVAVLGTITNASGINTIVRGTEGTLTFEDGGFRIEPASGSKLGRMGVSLVTQERDHMLNFLECMQNRNTPNCDVELAYRVQVPLIMSMLSFTEGKVALFDAATETIRMA
jgi:predicted dehydrogenase